MNCSPTIAIALMLLSLTGGMFLLYMTKKESLGILFKIMSWFIIVVSVGSIVCCAVFCGGGCGKGKCGGMEQCEMGGDEGCGDAHGKMNKHIMIMKGGHGECEMMEEGCCMDKMGCEEGAEGCEEGEMDCCKKGAAHECEMEGEKKCEMKMEVKKDSVVKKK